MVNSTSTVLQDSARGGFHLTVGNVLSGIVSALALIIIARILGSEQYGLYSISTVIPSLLLIFVDPGINQAIIKFSASLRLKREENRLRKLLLHGLAFKTFLSLIAFAVCFTFADQFAVHILHRPDAGGFIKIASTLIILQTVFTTLNSTFIGSDKTEYNAVTTVVQSIAKAIIAPALVVLGLSIAGALIGYVSSFVLAGILGTCLFASKIHRPLNHLGGDPEGFLENLKMLIVYGLPLYISVLIGGSTLQYRNILMALFTSNHEIGNFQAAMNFNTIVTSISIPIATVLLPAFSKMEGNEVSLNGFFKLSVKYTSMVILPIVILLMIYSGEIVQIIYGNGWELAPIFLSLSVATYFLVGLGFNVLGSFFNGIGETKTNLRITLVNSIILAILAPLLMWSFRLNGMIIAMLLSTSAGTLYGLHTARKTFGIEIDTRTITRIYLVSLASALPLLAMKQIPLYSNVIRIVIGAAAYFALYLLMIPIARIITPTELAEIRKVLERIRPLKYLAQPILYCEERIMRINH